MPVEAIQEIRKKLAKYPQVSYKDSDNFIEVFPNNSEGFPVSLNVSNNTYTVCYGDGWHEDFESEEEALNCFAFGLSSECRLKVTKKAGIPYKWEVQNLFDGGQWKTDSEVGSIFILISPLLFWIQREEVYLTNGLFQ